jgi:hypothetical protein
MTRRGECGVLKTYVQIQPRPSTNRTTNILTTISSTRSQSLAKRCKAKIDRPISARQSCTCEPTDTIQVKALIRLREFD